MADPTPDELVDRYEISRFIGACPECGAEMNKVEAIVEVIFGAPRVRRVLVGYMAVCSDDHSWPLPS